MKRETMLEIPLQPAHSKLLQGAPVLSPGRPPYFSPEPAPPSAWVLASRLDRKPSPSWAMIDLVGDEPSDDVHDILGSAGSGGLLEASMEGDRDEVAL